MKLKMILVLPLLILLVGYAMSAETLILKGKVINIYEEPLVGAKVSIERIGKTATTNESGSFSLIVPPGRYEINIEADDYNPYNQVIYLNSTSAKSMFEFQLMDIPMISVTVTTATRTERLVKDLPVRLEVVDKKEIEDSGADNLYEALDKGLVAGVSVETSCTNCQFSSIRMQGLESGYVGLLIDGQPIYSALAGVYLLRQIPPSEIERLEIVKGAGSALYGSSAIGGVINMITKQPSENKPKAQFSISFGEDNTYDMTGNISMRKGHFSGILTASKHENDYLDDNGDDYTDKVERDNSYIGFKTHYYPNSHDDHRITLFGRFIKEFRKGGYIPGGKPIEDDEGNIIGYTRGIDDALDPDAEHITTNRKEYGISYKGFLPSAISTELNLVTSKHKRNATNGERPFYSEEDIFQSDLVLSRDIFTGNTLSFGGNYRNETLDQRVNWENQEPMESDVIGIFVQDEIKFKSDIDVVLGVRYDSVESTLADDSAVSPRIAVKWNVTPRIALRTNIGGGFRVPYLFAEDLHLCSAAPIIEVADGIKPEKSWSYNFSTTYYGNGFDIDFNIFRTDIKDKIALDFDDELNLAVYDNAGDAYTQGFEINASLWSIDPFSLDAAFTYTDARYNKKLDPDWDDSKYIMRVPNITARLTFNFDEPNTGIRATISGRYIGKQYIEREMVIKGQDELEYHIDHVTDYALCDIKLGKTFLNEDLEIFIGAENLFDYTQETIYNADQEDTAAYIYAPLTGRYIYAGFDVRF